MLYDIKDSVFIADGSKRSAKELSGYLGSNIRINELGVFSFDSEKRVNAFNGLIVVRRVSPFIDYLVFSRNTISKAKTTALLFQKVY